MRLSQKNNHQRPHPRLENDSSIMDLHVFFLKYWVLWPTNLLASLTSSRTIADCRSSADYLFLFDVYTPGNYRLCGAAFCEKASMVCAFAGVALFLFTASDAVSLGSEPCGGAGG